MEVGLHVRDASEIRADLRLGAAAGWESSTKLSAWMTAVTERFAELPVSRFYFGTEFCENLLPTAAAVEAVAHASLPVTFLTPYVSDRGLAQLRPLLGLLRAGTEVVFADWGVLNVLRWEFPALVPVQGRLLNKSLRDPRVTNLYSIHGAENASLDAMRRSNLDNASYANLLERFGVTRVEMDHLPQGNHFELGGSAMRAHVYAPFGFISTSRVCMAAGLHYRGAEKFQPGAPCRHECQTHLLEYTYTNSPFENLDQQFWLKGNTYFYTHTGEMLDRLLEAPVDRLVFQPRVPMVTA
jgi:hypothetical protein